jgi:ABC-type lipoprotein release transport system permease subunit
MEDILLSWRNIWRNPRRSVLTILAIVFAAALLVFMLSFQFGAYEDMIESSVRLSTGHIQVQAVDYLDRPEMRKVVDNVDDVVKKVREIDNVEAAVVRSETFALAGGVERSRGVMVTGVNPEAELLISSLPGQIRKGRYLHTGAAGEAVIGTLAAEHLGLKIGDECTLLGQGRDGSVAATVVYVVGIYETGIDEFDRSSMQMTLSDFNSVFTMENGAHRVVLTLHNLSDAFLIADKLKEMPETGDLAVLTWDELTPGLKQSIELDLIGGVIMYVILVIVVAFSILNTFFMAIFERTREFGVLMSVGTKPLRLVKIMLIESMAMTTVGLLIGIALGMAVTLFFTKYGIGMGESSELLTQYGIADRLYPKLSAASIVIGPTIITIVTFITALIPAMKIPRMRPVEALRA